MTIGPCRCVGHQVLAERNVRGDEDTIANFAVAGVRRRIWLPYSASRGITLRRASTDAVFQIFAATGQVMANTIVRVFQKWQIDIDGSQIAGTNERLDIVGIRQGDRSSIYQRRGNIAFLRAAVNDSVARRSSINFCNCCPAPTDGTTRAFTNKTGPASGWLGGVRRG